MSDGEACMSTLIARKFLASCSAMLLLLGAPALAVEPPEDPLDPQAEIDTQATSRAAAASFLAPATRATYRATSIAATI